MCICELLHEKYKLLNQILMCGALSLYVIACYPYIVIHSYYIINIYHVIIPL